MANAGSRFSFATEVCAKLMNGARYAVADPPLDSEDHKEFENIVVSDAVIILDLIFDVVHDEFNFFLLSVRYFFQPVG